MNKFAYELGRYAGVCKLAADPPLTPEQEEIYNELGETLHGMKMREGVKPEDLAPATGWKPRHPKGVDPLHPVLSRVRMYQKARAARKTVKPPAKPHSKPTSGMGPGTQSFTGWTPQGQSGWDKSTQ